MTARLTTTPRLLIVDDESDMRWVLKSLFAEEGFEVVEAGDGRQALAQVQSSDPDVVLSDVRMPEIQGLDLLRELRRTRPELPVVLLSAVEDIATAVDAIKEGAFDYQAKPFEPERLLLTVRRAAEQHALRRELDRLKKSMRGDRVFFGRSEAARNLERTIDVVAPQQSISVLLVGESGTGKEVVAREIHRRSPAAGGPFMAVDCGALPEQLMESQLFGHKRGAFTGADRDRPGLFVLADGGSLFLDELGNLPPNLQAKLLRALQERAVVPVGGGEPVPFRARLLCATNTDLEQEVREGRFRTDLYHRVAEFTVRLPALRERPEDVQFFAEAFLLEANREMGRQVEGIGPAALRFLQQQPWPGNLRELRNAVRRATLLCAGRELERTDLSAAGPGASQPLDHPSRQEELPLAERIRVAAEELEARILEETLVRAAGNKAAAARSLGIDYSTLYRKLKKYDLLQ